MSCPRCLTQHEGGSGEGSEPQLPQNQVKAENTASDAVWGIKPSCVCSSIRSSSVGLGSSGSVWSEFLLSILDLNLAGYTPGVWEPGPGCVMGEDMAQERAQSRPQKTCIQRKTAAFCAVLAHNNGKVCKRQLRIKSGQDLGMWEVSVLDAREGDGTEETSQEG